MNLARRLFVVLLIGLVLVTGIAIGLYNSEPVRFDYLAGQAELPLIWLLTAVLAFAIVAALLAAAVPLLRQQRRIRRLERELRQAREALNVQRNLASPPDSPLP